MLERTSGGDEFPSLSSSRDASRDISVLNIEIKGKQGYVRDLGPNGPRMFDGLSNAGGSMMINGLSNVGGLGSKTLINKSDRLRLSMNAAHGCPKDIRPYMNEFCANFPTSLMKIVQKRDKEKYYFCDHYANLDT